MKIHYVLCVTYPRSHSLPYSPSATLSCLPRSFIGIASRVLTDFASDAVADFGRKLPVDGTVHETTSNVLAFIVQVFDYADVSAGILSQMMNLFLFMMLSWSSCCMCSYCELTDPGCRQCVTRTPYGHAFIRCNFRQYTIPRKVDKLR